MYLDAAKKQEIFGKYGKSNTDTGSSELPRQYFPKTLKPLNLSYVLDSEGAII